MLRRLEETVLLDADQETLWQILSDYPRLVNWMPGVTGSSEMVRDGDIVAIECKTPAFPDQHLVLELVESPKRSITFHQVDFYDKNGLFGSISLEPEGKSCRVSVSCSMSVSLFNFKFKRRAREAINKILAAAQERARAVITGELVLGGRRKILEVRQKANGLEIWFRGEVFSYVANSTPAGEA